LLAVVCAFGVAGRVEAQRRLACGEVATGSLQGGSDTYSLDVAAGSVGFVQGSFTSGDVDDTLRIRVTGPGVEVETCSNVAEFESLGGPFTVQVSACFGGRGAYRINTQVISASGDHCGRPLACGATPDGMRLAETGEVDSFRFPGLSGGAVDLRVSDMAGRHDPYLVRVYDPEGNRVIFVCAESVHVPTSSGRDYTVLISACGAATTGDYRIERDDPRCPTGPTITAMAFLPQNRSFVLPTTYDAAGRPVYVSSGTGTIIVEGRVGPSGRGISGSAFEFGRPPPFQSIVSRPLGNGDPAVCDRDALPPGGIAAAVPFAFRADAAAVDRINDLGCRYNNGQGAPLGRRDPLNSCVRASFAYVDPTTAIQFCADLIDSERFPFGDTIVAARMSDLDGTFGTPREIVVRVSGLPPPSATPSPTRTVPPPTAPPTATPTARPTRPPVTRLPGPCTCDCDENGAVRVDEMTRCVRIALGRMLLQQCPSGDRDGNGAIAIGELIDGVRNTLLGCPPAPARN
jgi:hypothetical protein